MKPSPAKYAALANTSRSGSFEGEGSSSARQLLRNVKQEAEQEADHMQPSKKRRPFVKKSSSPSHLAPGGSSTGVSKIYNRLGILYSSSPDPSCGFSPPNFSQGAANESSKFGGLLGVSGAATLPPGLSTDVRLREGHSAATGGGGVSIRPASFHIGMRTAVNQRMVSCESESTGDPTARDVGEAVGGRTGAVGQRSPVEHGSPNIKDSVFLSSGTIQQDPSLPISLRASDTRVDKVGTTSASSPDSGYGNTPENNPGTANVPEGESPSRLQVQTASEQLQERGTSDEVAVGGGCSVVHHEFSPEPREMNPNQTSQTGHQTGQTDTAIAMEPEVSTHLRTVDPGRDPIEITLEDHSDRDTQRFRSQINQPFPPRSDSIPSGSNSIPPRPDPIFRSIESSLDWGGMRPPVLCVDIEDSATNLPHRLQKKGLPRTPSVPEYLFSRVNSESTAHSSSPPDPSSTHSHTAVPSVQYMQYNRVSREFTLASGSPTGSPKFSSLAADGPRAVDKEEDKEGFSGLGRFRDRTKHVGSSREILEKLEAAVAKGRQRSHSQPLIKAAGKKW